MKLLLKIVTVFILIAIAIFFLYFNKTSLTNPRTVQFYHQLKDTLKARGSKAKLLVISTKRFKWHNAIQVKLSGAASKSKHLTGDALDFIVFDVNSDGTSDSKDVDLVYKILDKEIIAKKGGVGTYKTESSFVSKQMIHIDCRIQGSVAVKKNGTQHLHPM